MKDECLGKSQLIENIVKMVENDQGLVSRADKQRYLKSCNIIDEDILEEIEDFEVNVYFQMAISSDPKIRRELNNELKRRGYYSEKINKRPKNQKNDLIYVQNRRACIKEILKLEKDVFNLEKEIRVKKKKLQDIDKYLENGMSGLLQ